MDLSNTSFFCGETLQKYSCSDDISVETKTSVTSATTATTSTSIATSLSSEMNEEYNSLPTILLYADDVISGSSASPMASIVSYDPDYYSSNRKESNVSSDEVVLLSSSSKYEIDSIDEACPPPVEVVDREKENINVRDIQIIHQQMMDTDFSSSSSSGSSIFESGYDSPSDASYYSNVTEDSAKLKLEYRERKKTVRRMTKGRDKALRTYMLSKEAMIQEKMVATNKWRRVEREKRRAKKQQQRERKKEKESITNDITEGDTDASVPEAIQTTPSSTDSTTHSSDMAHNDTNNTDNEIVKNDVKVSWNDALKKQFLFEWFYSTPALGVILVYCVIHSSISHILNNIVLEYFHEDGDIEDMLIMLFLSGLFMLRISGCCFSWLKWDYYGLAKYDIRNKLRLGERDAKIIRWFKKHKAMTTCFEIFGFYFLFYVVDSHMSDVVLPMFCKMNQQILEGLPSLEEEGVQTYTKAVLSMGYDIYDFSYAKNTKMRSIVEEFVDYYGDDDDDDDEDDDTTEEEKFWTKALKASGLVKTDDDVEEKTCNSTVEKEKKFWKKALKAAGLAKEKDEVDYEQSCKSTVEEDDDDDDDEYDYDDEDDDDEDDDDDDDDEEEEEEDDDDDDKDEDEDDEIDVSEIVEGVLGECAINAMVENEETGEITEKLFLPAFFNSELEFTDDFYMYDRVSKSSYFQLMGNTGTCVVGFKCTLLFYLSTLFMGCCVFYKYDLWFVFF